MSIKWTEERGSLHGEYKYEYGRDASHVYWKQWEIVGADPKTFRIFKGQQPIEGCGAGPYSADAHSVFWQSKRVAGADPATFNALVGSDDYGYDKSGVWHKDVLEPNLTKETIPQCRYGE